VTVDIIIRYKGGIVLIERKNEPAGWPLPGGFVDLGESLEEAAGEAREKHRSITLIEQFHAYSKPERTRALGDYGLHRYGCGQN
jgi:ADP-ribose pyrophosphatase YjhB (NUDIX family)